MTPFSICPVCSNTSGHFVLEQRGPVPTLQNIALATVQEARSYPQGWMKILLCGQCGFVWNDAFDPALICYDAFYNNDVSHSPYYQQHMQDMADRVIASVPADQPIHYVEIGCGEGDFLRLVVQRAGGRCLSAIGFDPSFTGEEHLPDGACVIKSFFGPEQAKHIPAQANVICSRHTIEHVPDVQAFATALRASMEGEDRQLFLETPNVDWILRHGAFQDFFYEHCSLYTPGSMIRLLNQHGLSADVNDVYDRQYMWVHSRRQGKGLTVFPAIAPNLGEAQSYVEGRATLVAQLQTYIKARIEHGPVAIWGAASKGVTFTLLCCDRPDVTVAYAIDLNTLKQNRYLPLTGIEVISPQRAVEHGVKTVIIMNPNYAAEIKSLISGMNWAPEIVVLNDSAQQNDQHLQ